MTRERKIYCGKCAVIFMALPMLLWAFSSGPPPRRTGGPGDQTCLQLGTCHSGVRITDSTQVTITVAGGNTYTPGGANKQITITNNDAEGRRFGFQASARAGADEANTPAGNFINGPATQVICEDDQPRPSAAGCTVANRLEFIEHNNATTSNAWTFEWRPPATNVGPVNIYVASNASISGQNNPTRIHTLRFTLTPDAVTPPPPVRPSISAGGVVSVVNFGGSPTVAPGTWMEIYGSNFGTVTRDWGTAFSGDNAPTSLENIRVTIGGRAAFVSFISPGQINAQVPDGVGVGPTTLTVTNPNGVSDNFNITVAAKSPAFLAPPTFRASDNRQFLVALGTDFVANVGPFVSRAGLIPGVSTRSARPGETLVVFGIGWGPVTPAVAPGVIARGITALPNFSLRFNQTAAAVSYAGLAPNFVGLYQFNVVVPAVPAGEYRINVTSDGTNLAQEVYLAVQP